MIRLIIFIGAYTLGAMTAYLVLLTGDNSFVNVYRDDRGECRLAAMGELVTKDNCVLEVKDKRKP